MPSCIQPNKARLSVEPLDERLVLSTVAFNPSTGFLAVDLSGKGAGQRLQLSASADHVLLNGKNVKLKTGSETLHPTGVRSIRVQGSRFDDRLDLSQVTLASFPNLDGSMLVNGRGGNDQLIGSALNDLLRGGDGKDTLKGLAGDDVLYGGAGADTLWGGDGDDVLQALFEGKDVLDGGAGTDRAYFDSFDLPQACEVWNPLQATPDNPSIKVRVLVLNYDPLIPSQGNKHLYDLFGWNNPRDLAKGYEETMERASGGAVEFEVVEWRDLNEIPPLEDGFRYEPDDYYQRRLTNSGWHVGGGNCDYARIMIEQGVPDLVSSGAVDEVWWFGDHYFGVLEASMAGPRAFFINGGVYPHVPSSRAFAIMGFSYERGVAEMMHNNCHRFEATMNRVYGGWNLGQPTSNWDRFSANVAQSRGVAGVGTCHFPANATGNYDYGNNREVKSWADDFLDYPHLNGAATTMSGKTWRRLGTTIHPGRIDDQYDYLQWYYLHFPRGAGVNPDGKLNNWWKYTYDFNTYVI